MKISRKILDISSYVHCGLEVEDIEEKINEVIEKIDGTMATPIYTLLYYKITTKYKLDKDVDNLMRMIVNELDIMLAEKLDIKVRENLN